MTLGRSTLAVMTSSTVLGRVGSVIFLVAALSLVGAGTASAQGFVSGFIGYDFSGDTGCGAFDSDCEDRHSSWGGAVGALGGLFGFELDFGYSPDFFGESEDTSSSVLTVMGNVMIGPKIGPVQPYGLAGLGLIKTKVEFTSSGLLDNDNNKFGWDVGGGLMVFFGEHVGVRGDLRYMHAFQALELLGIDIQEEDKLDFGRATVGVVVKF
jgi:opacity protein-like surface antigen